MKVDWKPFSAKALAAMNQSDAFINILEGAVRSSKTLSSIVAWLGFIEQSPHREFLMTGKTTDTLFRNVIDGATGILSIMGSRARYIKASQGGAKLLLEYGKVTKVCYCIGAYNEGSEGRIRGMTVAGWYADEITLYPESFVKQAINRMSLSGRRAFWTTNPDSPYHYIKTEFIDKAQEKGFKTWHFELNDNYALDDDYKESLRKSYSGLWYKRMVDGLWVVAEGSIYDMWDEEKYTFDKEPTKNQDYQIWCDYGTHNPCVFLLVAKDEESRYWVLKEYYHNSREVGRQKTDKQYREDLMQFVGKYPVSRVIIDPSAASFITELEQNTPFSIIQANNDVLDGIRKTATTLETKRLFIHKSCKNVLREFPSYVWDPKAQKHGEDKPIKDNDHALDCVRYGIMTQHMANIRTVDWGDDDEDDD